MMVRQSAVLALDGGLPGDASEGLKPKMRRGKLIAKIQTALAGHAGAEMSSGDITPINERTTAFLTAASVAREIALLLDPATEGK